MLKNTSGYVTVPEGQLYFETSGSPDHPALVMVHAGVANLRMWDDQAAAFADRFYCVRYDTRGYWRSISENTRFSNRADLVAVLDHLGIKKAIVMGCSLGGQTAIDFALEFPRRVRALILVGAGLGGYEDVQPDQVEIDTFDAMEKAALAGDWDQVDALHLRVWYDGLSRRPEQVDSGYRAKGAVMLRENRPHLLKHGMEGLQSIPLDPPAADRLNKIKVPTLVVIGDLDSKPEQQVAEVLEKRIAGAKRIVMPGTAHLPNLEFPAQFNQHVATFLAGLDPVQ